MGKRVLLFAKQALLQYGLPIMYVLIFVIELLCYAFGKPLNRFSILPFIGSSALTIVMLYVLFDVVSFFPKRTRIILSCILGLFFSVTIVSGIVVFSQFGEFVTQSKIQFFTNNFAYTLVFAKSFLCGIYGVIGIILVCALSLIVFYTSTGMHDRRKSFRKDLILLPVLILLYFVAMNQYSRHAKNLMIDMHTSLCCAVKSVKRKIPRGFIRDDIRKIPDEIVADNPYNVLLIINESYGEEAFNCDDSTAMPLLKQRIGNNKDRSFYFRNAVTNASSTEISVSSLLTGVAPYAGKQELYEMPFIWQWYKSAGYQTAYLSAQKFSWMGFDVFIERNPDIKICADDGNFPLINDGIDEGYMCKIVMQNLDKLIDKGKFCLVYNTNVCHRPFMQQSNYLPTQAKFASHLKNSTIILDCVIDTVLNYLDKKKVLDSTIVIITGDHGECESKIHQQNRIESYYDEFQKVPLTIILPTPLAKKYAGTMEYNTNQLVANIDILPTLISLLAGNNYTEKNKALIDKFYGFPLTKRIDDNRFSVSINTNDIRGWDREGFGIFFKDYRFVFHDVKGVEMFDIRKDPKELHDIWKTAPKEQKKNIHEIINSIFHLKRMYKEKIR